MKVMPLIVLNPYCINMMGSNVNCIQVLGLEVKHIPAGCMYFDQPVNVGLKHPIEQEMTEKWDEWMLDGSDEEGRVAKTPSRQSMAQQIMGAYKTTNQQMG